MSAPQWGHVAEWLRSGLQNRLHQFNSGRGLHFQTSEIIDIFGRNRHRVIRRCTSSGRFRSDRKVVDSARVLRVRLSNRCAATLGDRQHHARPFEMRGMAAPVGEIADLRHVRFFSLLHDPVS
jgi:hypothetical protein